MPEGWEKKARREAQEEEDEEQDGRDLLPGVDSSDDDVGEGDLYQLAMEFGEDFGDVEAQVESLQEEEAKADASQGKYALIDVSKVLSAQMKEYAEWRSAVLCGTRRGKRVQEITIASDSSTLLRYMGWLSRQPGQSGPLDLSIFTHPDAANRIQNFCKWCVEQRGMQYSSLGNYINSLLSWVSFAIAETELEVLDALYDTVFHLRTQAEGEGREQRLYKKRHSAWIDWEEAQQTRLNAIAALEACQDRQEKLEIAEDVLICAFYTCQPPDRVSVIRKLSFGNTLKKRNGQWIIDLSSPRTHKVC